MALTGLAGAIALCAPAPCHAQGYVISTIAGGNPYITGNGDGQAATAAFLNAPSAVAADTAGNVYIADTGSHSVRRLSTSGIISAFAGGGGSGFSGDGAAAISATLRSPAGVA